jgi:hypothetical protein
MRQDPIGFRAGDADLYRYGRNSPSDAVDPSGQDSIFGQGSVSVDPNLAYPPGTFLIKPETSNKLEPIAPGETKPADGLFWSGGVIKVPDNCDLYITNHPTSGRVVYIYTTRAPWLLIPTFYAPGNANPFYQNNPRTPQREPTTPTWGERWLGGPHSSRNPDLSPHL